MSKQKSCLRIVVIYIAVLLGLILWLTSCVTYERCVDKYGVYPGDTLLTPIKVEVPVFIHVPPDSATLQAALDSLLAGRVIETDTINKKDSSNISVKIWYDKNTNSINAEAKQKPFTIYDTIPYYDTITVIAPPVLVKPLTFKEKAIKLYYEVAAWTFPFFLFILLMEIAVWRFRK
jgi:hypothetical protein